MKKAPSPSPACTARPEVFSSPTRAVANDAGGARGVVDLHACHIASGPSIHATRWLHRPMMDVPMRGASSLVARSTAGFEGGTKIYINTITPQELCELALHRLRRRRLRGAWLRDQTARTSSIPTSGNTTRLSASAGWHCRSQLPRQKRTAEGLTLKEVFTCLHRVHLPRPGRTRGSRGAHQLPGIRARPRSGVDPGVLRVDARPPGALPPGGEHGTRDRGEAWRLRLRGDHRDRRPRYRCHLPQR